MTIDREHLDRIQADLDGELDGPARAELARYLLAHPEARAEREALSRVCAALATIPAEDPPADLQSRIMAALPPSPRGVAPSAARGRSSGAFFLRREPLRLVAGLAGVALVATLAYQLGSTRAPLPSDHLVGTMGQPVRQEARPALGPARDEARIRVNQFSALVALHGAPTAPGVSVSVESGAGLELIARAGGQEVRLDGAALRQSSKGMQVIEFQPLAQPGVDAVQVDIVEPESGAVLQRTMLRFERER